MPPLETTQLLPNKHLSFQEAGDGEKRPSKFPSPKLALSAAAIAVTAVVFVCSMRNNPTKRATGPYKLIELQEGKSFFDFYDFHDGPDSLGSAGFNTYVGREKAEKQGLVNISNEGGKDFIYIQSQHTEEGMRESIRLEGKHRFDRGLFILDLVHMPTGCGVWPAWWLTDESAWPNNGEVDIVESINNQNVAKTALHTSESCTQYAHVPNYVKTGVWDTATGIPNKWTGIPDNETKVEADNCWVLAPHQWANQGCVQISSQNGTLGQPLNAKGGGVFALEWDPENRYIRSWVFTPHSNIPDNLQSAIDTASRKSPNDQIMPDPNTWGLPYAYFAIGASTGCSADHFKSMRIVLNLAFCGTVAGNRFISDCPILAKKFNVSNDPVLSCNAYIKSNPKALQEAYWKIRGIYVYERELEYHWNETSGATSR